MDLLESVGAEVDHLQLFVVSEDGPELRDAIARHDGAGPVLGYFAAQEQLLQQWQVSEHCGRELGEPVLALVDANLWKRRMVRFR